MTNPNPTNLFLSYAAEDLALARWLAQKLAARGHPVWFDKIKSLAGEPWPQTVDEVVKSRTFRMLAIISEHSLRKKKPALERMLAQRVIRQQNVPDFLIPLKLDNSQPDPLTDMTSAISFEDGWADGWKALLKQLDSIKAPRSLQNGAQLAGSSFPRGSDLISDTGERPFANIIRIKSFPNALRVFQAAHDMDSDEWEALGNAWTFYEISRDILVALIPPPPEFGDRVRPTREMLHWVEPGAYHNVQIRDLAAALIVQALARRLIKAGCLRHPNPKFKETFFLPETFDAGGQLAFMSFEGKKLRMPIRSKAAFRRVGGMTEVDFCNFAFRIRVARGLDKALFVQLTPTLVFFDERGKTFDEKSALSRLRRVTKTWGNEEWLNRAMAAEQVLSSSAPVGVNDPVLEPGLVRLDSTTKLDDAVLASDSTRTVLPEQEFELEELEAEEGDE